MLHHPLDHPIPGLICMRSFRLHATAVFSAVQLSLCAWLSAACAPAAWAITFVDDKPAVAWTSIQTANSAGCEMSAANGRLIYVGQCQNALPHGRGLLVSPDKDIQGAKMDKGTAFQFGKLELMQDLRPFEERARYLQAFHRIGWTEDGFDSLPGPQSSAVVTAARQFIAQFGARDSDSLVPRAERSVQQAAARAHARAWNFVEMAASSSQVARYITLWQGRPEAGDMGRAETIGRHRFRSEYDADFRRVDDIHSAQSFLGTYARSDPDRRLPIVRNKLAVYEHERREAIETQQRARAARIAREAANPMCVAQRKTCLSQCTGYSESTHARCEIVCESIRCD